MEFYCDVLEHIAVLSKSGNLSKELNLISYNGGPPKLDLRSWWQRDDGRRQMLKGVTLTDTEALKLLHALQWLNENGGLPW